jgi:hypothetical protein
VAGWVAWSWPEPVYYTYGPDSYVYCENNVVYVDGKETCSQEEYVEQAANIAASVPEIKEDQEVEWLPLGVFALTAEDEGDPNMLLQLAVSKEGIIAGTYHNESTDSTEPVEGMVDKESQRAAWTIGENKNIVMETGVYNLTEDQTQVMVHFGKDKTQQWLMVRLEEPESEGSQEK